MRNYRLRKNEVIPFSGTDTAPSDSVAALGGCECHLQLPGGGIVIFIAFTLPQPSQSCTGSSYTGGAVLPSIFFHLCGNTWFIEACAAPNIPHRTPEF